MNREHKKAMWLDRAELPGKGILAGILPCLLAILAYAVLTLTVSSVTGFRDLYNPALAVTAGVIICLIFGLLDHFRLHHWFVPGMLAVLLLLLIIGRAWLAEGFRLFWNQTALSWTSGNGLVLEQWQTLFPERQKLCLMLFSLAWAVAAGMLCCLLARWKPVLLAAALPLTALAGVIGFHTQEPLSVITAAFLAGYFLYLGSGWTKQSETDPFFTWILCGAAAALVLAVVSLPGIDQWADNYSRDFRQRMHEKKYETQYTTLPEGKLEAVTEENPVDQPALIVTMSQPEAMYLRGFTGAVFDGICWSEQSTAVLARNRELLYWMNLYEFNPLCQFEAALLDWEQEDNQITVQNIGACSRYRYVPYSLRRTSIVPEDLRTDSLLAEGERVHFYSAVMNADSLLWPLLEELQNNEQEATMNYRRAESAYRAYVTQYYLDIPEDALSVLGAAWDGAAEPYGGKEKLTPQTAQLCAKSILDQLEAEEMPSWQEQLPAAGTVYQDATVAVLTLRYFGFPARYAEGYIISEEMVAAAKGDTTFQVGSHCAGAWAEVYQDGIGWIPAALTFGAADSSTDDPQPEDSLSSQESDSAEGFGGVDAESGNGFIKEGQELEEFQEQEEQLEEQQEQESSIQLPESLLKILLGILLSLLLLILLILIRYFLLCKKKEKKFQNENVNDAVAWVFTDTAQMLDVLGFRRGNGSMLPVCALVSERLGQVYGQELEAMTQLNARAMFSSKVLTEAQRTQMLQFRRATIEQIKRHTKWYRSLWLKWIRCLY